MAEVYAKFYLDKGGIVREMIYKDEEVKFYINHEKVSIDTYSKIMVNEFPYLEPFLLQMKQDMETPKEPEYIEVDFRKAITHGFLEGTVIVIDEDENQIDFNSCDSHLHEMLEYAREGCSWFIPIDEYKNEKEN